VVVVGLHQESGLKVIGWVGIGGMCISIDLTCDCMGSSSRSGGCLGGIG